MFDRGHWDWGRGTWRAEGFRLACSSLCGDRPPVRRCKANAHETAIDGCWADIRSSCPVQCQKHAFVRADPTRKASHFWTASVLVSLVVSAHVLCSPNAVSRNEVLRNDPVDLDSTTELTDWPESHISPIADVPQGCHCQAEHFVMFRSLEPPAESSSRNYLRC